MACKTVSVSIYYDVNNVQTGEFSFECEDTCPDEKVCAEVQYDNRKERQVEWYCGCPQKRDGGKVGVVDTPPPDRAERCGNIFLAAVHLSGGRRKLEPMCRGACAEGDCKPRRIGGEDDWETRKSGNNVLRHVRVETWKCECH